MTLLEKLNGDIVARRKVAAEEEIAGANARHRQSIEERGGTAALRRLRRCGHIGGVSLDASTEKRSPIRRVVAAANVAVGGGDLPLR